MPNTLNIQNLASEILKHKSLYYSGRPIISDEAYDKLESELRELSPEHPVLKLVGFLSVNNESKISHSSKMLSLDKKYSIEELKSWIKDREVISLFKIDGSSCSIVYENGILAVAKTRGDGEVGENITNKVSQILSVPKFVEIKGTSEVRGEIYCTEENFIGLSEEMVKMGLDKPSSQRNIVAGLLGRKEHSFLAKYLSFRAFELISDDKYQKESDKLNILSYNGFTTPEYKVHKNLEELEERIEETRDFLANGSYLIDGLVFVFNEISLHHELGETGHHPKYKIAFKFQGSTANAKIKSIDWQISRNGVLTPVANIEPVELSGAMISRVTLHNFGQARNHNLAPGDLIEVVRSGEVIPKFLGVVTKSSNNFSNPSTCQSCATDLIVNDIRLICPNRLCQAQLKEQILHYINQANIEDLSDKRLDEMMTKGLVKSIPDLYKLTLEGLLSLDKVKDKMAQKLLANIHATKNQKLAQFISAVGIEGVSSGSKIEKLTNAGFADLESIRKMTVDQLVKIDGFAAKSSYAFKESFDSKSELINELLNLGVTVKSEVIEKSSNSLEGASIVITGELSSPRKEFELLIKQNGGILSGSVSKKTTYLVTNETNSSSSKFVKAKELGVKIISEAELKLVIGGQV